MDPKFDELEQKVLSIDALLRQLLRDIGNWQEELQVSILNFGPYSIQQTSLWTTIWFSNLLSNLVCKLQHVVEVRETLSEGMDLYCSGAESLTNYHHLLHSLQQAVKNNVSRINNMEGRGLNFVSRSSKAPLSVSLL